MIGVEQWAEIRRLCFVEKRSKCAIHRLTGVHRDTVTRAIECAVAPKYTRAPEASKRDPFKDWICEQLRADPSIQSLRLREMASELGYDGGKTIFDDLRARSPAQVPCQAHVPAHDLPTRRVGVVRSVGAQGAGAGRARPDAARLVVTAELCWSRVIAGALIFSKQAPDILRGLGRCLERIGALPEKLVWDREGAIHAGGGRPSVEFAAFCGQLGVGWISLDAGDAQANGALERSHRYMRSAWGEISATIWPPRR